jgi:hypothetical protein
VFWPICGEFLGRIEGDRYDEEFDLCCFSSPVDDRPPESENLSSINHSGFCCRGSSLLQFAERFRTSARFGLNQESFGFPRVHATTSEMSAGEVLSAFHRDAPYLFSDAAFVAVGLVSATFAVIRRKRDSLLIYFAIFSIFYGLRLWIQATLLGITVQDSTLFDIRPCSGIGYITSFLFQHSCSSVLWGCRHGLIGSLHTQGLSLVPY